MKARWLVVGLMALGLLWITAALAAAQGPESALEAQAAASRRWVPVSEPGFGNSNAYYIMSLVPAGQYLYAGALDDSNGADLYRSADGANWTLITDDGFGDPDNVAVEHLAEFKGHLYAGTVYRDTGTESAQILRSTTGVSWTQVTPAGLDPTNKEIGRFIVFGGMLYATTWNYADTHGSEIWRTASGDSGDWTRVVDNGFGDADNAATSTEVFGGRLYMGTWNGALGGQVWRSDSGDAGDWHKVNADGFGDAHNSAISALAAFDGYLYASTRTRGSGVGVQVWRCQTCDGADWVKVVDNGFGDPDTNWTSGLEVFDGRLYLLAGNGLTGLQAWRTVDGVAWENVGRDGLTSPTNLRVNWDNTLAVFENHIYAGTFGRERQGEVVRYVPGAAFLPVVQR